MELGEGFLAQIATLLQAHPLAQSQLKRVELLAELSAWGGDALMDPQLLLLLRVQGRSCHQRFRQSFPFSEQPVPARKRPTSTAGLPIGLHQPMPKQRLRLTKGHTISGEQDPIEGLVHLSRRTGGDEQIGAIGHHRHGSQGHQTSRWRDAAGFDQAACGGSLNGLGGLAVQHPQTALTAQGNPGNRERETKGGRWQRPRARSHD